MNNDLEENMVEANSNENIESLNKAIKTIKEDKKAFLLLHCIERVEKDKSLSFGCFHPNPLDDYEAKVILHDLKALIEILTKECETIERLLKEEEMEEVRGERLH